MALVDRFAFLGIVLYMIYAERRTRAARESAADQVARASGIMGRPWLWMRQHPVLRRAATLFNQAVLLVMLLVALHLVFPSAHLWIRLGSRDADLRAQGFRPVSLASVGLPVYQGAKECWEVPKAQVTPPSWFAITRWQVAQAYQYVLEDAHGDAVHRFYAEALGPLGWRLPRPGRERSDYRNERGQAVHLVRRTYESTRGGPPRLLRVLTQQTDEPRPGTVRASTQVFLILYQRSR